MGLIHFSLKSLSQRIYQDGRSFNNLCGNTPHTGMACQSVSWHWIIAKQPANSVHTGCTGRAVLGNRILILFNKEMCGGPMSWLRAGLRAIANKFAKREVSNKTGCCKNCNEHRLINILSIPGVFVLSCKVSETFPFVESGSRGASGAGLYRDVCEAVSCKMLSMQKVQQFVCAKLGFFFHAHLIYFISSNIIWMKEFQLFQYILYPPTYASLDTKIHLASSNISNINQLVLSTVTCQN